MVEATVVDITTGDPADLEGLDLSGRAAGQVPYCVTVSIKNASDADLPFASCRIFVASSGTRVNSVAYEGFESPYAEEPIVWR